MCVYCMIGDWAWKYNPPWPNRDPFPTSPNLPLPNPPALTPDAPWELAKLYEFYDLLKRVKALEDELGCPCEPNKADHIGLLRQRIEQLEKQQKEKR